MKSKKRWVIGFWVAAALVVILAVGMVAVLAAFTATTSSGFQVSYTAGANVEATITGTYKVGSNSAVSFRTAEGSENITFNTGGAETTSMDFEKVSGITMGKDDIIILTYVIKNNSTKAAVKLTASASVTSTLTVQYSKDNSTWKTSINDSAVIPTSGLSISKGATQSIYIKLSVPTDKKTTAASFDGDFDFALTTV